MLHTILSRLGWFIALLALQVFVFNHIHLFGYATPMPYVYLLLILPMATPRWLYVLAGFVLGLSVDLFTNTPGVAAAATCLAGLLAPVFLRMYVSGDVERDSFEPSSRTMEWAGFLKFTFTLVLIHSIAFFSLEAFSFAGWQALLIHIGGSTLLTTLLVAAMERIRTT